MVLLNRNRGPYLRSKWLEDLMELLSTSNVQWLAGIVSFSMESIFKLYFMQWSHFSNLFLYLGIYNSTFQLLLTQLVLVYFKKFSFSKLALTIHGSKKLFWWSQKFYQFSAVQPPIFQKFFAITRTSFSHSRSEQFLKTKNTISYLLSKYVG